MSWVIAHAISAVKSETPQPVSRMGWTYLFNVRAGCHKSSIT